MDDKVSLSVPKNKCARKITARGTPERHVAKELGGFAQELALEFDLSPEMTRTKPKGVKCFQSHNPTGKDGFAKIGGAGKEAQPYVD